MAARAPMPGLPPPPKQPVRMFHRGLGLIGALFLMLLIGTGIALQHPKSLGLDTVYVEAPWLLDWYGVTAPEATVFMAGAYRLARVGDGALLDGQWLELPTFDLIGAVVTGDSIVLLAANELAIVTPAGEIVERMQMPARATTLGLDTEARVHADTADGVYTLDDALTNWQRAAESAPIQWSQGVAPTAAEMKTLHARYRARLITVERLLLDLHSGRVFGTYGTWIIDMAALLLLALAVTGLLLAGRR